MHRIRAMSLLNVKKHSVFVYGTLKRGEPNHQWLQVKDYGYAKFIGRGKTIEKYPLVIASKYNIPFLLHSPGIGKNVIGEIYLVNDHMLSNLDVLESHPDFYSRELKQVEVITQEEKENSLRVHCWIYFLKQFKSYLLSEPYLDEYHSAGNHLKPYIPPHKRIPGYNIKSEVLLTKVKFSS